MARNIGFIIDRLAKSGFLRPGVIEELRLDTIILDYLKACMNHIVDDVKRAIVYNLPSFYKHFRFWEPNLDSSFSEYDESRSFMDNYYLELM
jgi:hypothetical protein